MKRISLAVLSAVAAAAALFLAQALWAQSQDLATLIQSGETKQALEQIGAGADVNKVQPDGSSPLLWAVNRSEPGIVEALLAKKADPNAANQFGATPLTEAARVGDASMVKMLLAAGAKVDSANPDGETALMVAIQGGDLPIVEMLVNAGANVNTIEKFHDQTPLIYAAAGGRADMVKLLLAKGADVKPRALYTDWPSQVTSEPRTQYRSVGGLTALLYAARSGCYDCVDQLIAAGADVNVPTPEGITALMIALDNSHNDVAKLLMAHGAKLDVWDWWGRTPLWIAVDRIPVAPGVGGFAGFGRGGGRGPGRGGRGPALEAPPESNRPEVKSIEVIDQLLEAGVDPNPEMNFHRPNAPSRGRFGDNHVSTGTTALFRAVQLEDKDAVEALLNKGADPNVVSMGYTAFLLAAGAGPPGRGGPAAGQANMPILELIMQHAPDVNTKVTGTELWSYNVSRVYSTNGRRPATNEGMTALHTAAQAGNRDLVQYLLEHGADPDILNADGKKAIDLVGTGRGGPGGARGGGPGAAQAKGKGPAPAAAKGGPARGGARGGPGGAGGRGPSPADLAEIRTLLETASAKK